MSVNSVNPGFMFGGVWEEFGQGRFLIGAGSPKANNTNFFGDLNNNNYGFYSEEMGGQYLHTLTWNEMPSHVHGVYYPNDSGPYGIADGSGEYCYPQPSGVKKTWGANMSNTMSAGSTQAHNNMPPYIGAYMWKRIA
jgi:microcystin-dependent protein